MRLVLDFKIKISQRVNQISVQPEPSAATHPNGRFQLDTPTLTKETDRGTSSEEEFASDYDSESESDSHSGSNSRSKSPSEPDITSGKPSVLSS